MILMIMEIKDQLCSSHHNPWFLDQMKQTWAFWKEGREMMLERNWDKAYKSIKNGNENNN